MQLLNTIHKRKSATITAIIILLLLLMIFFFGLKYLDPPIESGIAVNFGTSNVGSGNIQPTEPVKTQPVPQVTEQEEVVEEEVEDSAPEDSPAEDVITAETEESIRIKKAEAERLKAKAEADKKAKAEAEAERQAKAEAERIKKEQQDKKRKLDELMGGIKNSEGSTSGGEGDDNVGGDKGSENGDPNADGYYGNGGSGGGGDYQLGSRRPISKPKPEYDCNEEGLVIVTIEVDRAGKVIKATPGTKGSTNNAACLLTRAKEAALKTTWQADSNAGSKQIGIIKYRFSLSN
ncbi:energy transducer TonB [Urechidicola croceus]|uniref:Energy transducer TonB n=1 Tax=Urechidicola croceus TaxID=1850246 RepID=A0A1D8P6Y2_9FLAO|nr:energy transducer TonB [Urechidicola croceus]AOW20339.1 energy transducer TonB [Urechidicola croceus]